MHNRAGSDSFADCYNKALDLLSRRAHFERELERKLRSRGFSESDIAKSLESLQEKGLLDDAEAARRFAASRRRSRNEVGVRLIQELRKRGVDADLAERVVDAMDRSEEPEMARSVARSLAGRGAGRERIGRHLQRKGFRQADILASLDLIAED